MDFNDNEFNEFNEIMRESEELSKIDISTFPLMDQVRIALAFQDYIKTIKPIYAKNLSKKPGSTFLFKM